MAEVQEALQKWGEINLAQRLAEYGPVGLEIEKTKKQSLESRKKLVEETKAFKKLEDADKVAQLEGLLKAYQGEIDAVTKRAKMAESNFLQFYQLLYEAPDPADTLRAAQSALKSQEAMSQQQASADTGRVRELTEKLRAAELKCTKMQKELKDMEDEFKTVKNQEVKVRQLEGRLAEVTTYHTELLEKEIHQRDEHWAKAIEQLKGEQEGEVVRLRSQIAEQERMKTYMESEVEEAERQLLQAKQRHEEDLMNKQSELDTVAAELERKTQDLETLKAQQSQQDQSKVESVMHSLNAAQHRIKTLEADLDNTRAELYSTHEKSRQREADLLRQLEDISGVVRKRDEELVQVRDELQRRPTVGEVSELRQKLRNAEVVEHGDIDGASTDLERRLLEKQKQLEGQLSSFRVKCHSQEDTISHLTQESRSFQERVDDLQQLVTSLENQLSQAQAQGAAEPSTATLGGINLNLTPHTPPASSVAASLPVAGPAGDGDKAALGAGGGGGGGGGAGVGSAAGAAMPSMMEIVTAQRDRFRQKVLEVEQSRDMWKSSTEQERLRADKLHSDNITLVEKIKYLQSWQPKQGPGGGRGGRSRPGRGPAAAAGIQLQNFFGGGKTAMGEKDSPQAADDVESRYSSAYEASVDPFTSFREQEKLRKVQALSFGERVTIGVGGLLLSTRFTRLAALGYVLCLHALVFVMLYRLTHHNCPPGGPASF
ncbi:unnamed protein product [Vitrella brassicaformis CCMP3155]|uniref:Protein CASP n=3 Tax=Vitrella brassicaformis TaxID=1169539 RepID=A0A0G4GW60_VITBC|nr:unnamed protein product [Vitrella brassicaformis CCMP3155]|eukprot:CEM35197.1 unnamed protein product [Vitrella brassicaformis CCMP3155]